MKKSSSGLTTEKVVKQLTTEWKSTLPTNIGNLFSYEYQEAIRRIERYDLAKGDIKTILTLNTIKKGKKASTSNIKNITILMGKGEYQVSKSTKKSGPDNQLFQPILEINLHTPIQQKKVTYHFLLSPVFKALPLQMFFQVQQKEDLSPRVAELFILNWQSLTDTALMNAFEGLAGDSMSIDNSSGLEHAEITFGRQRLRRVNKYIYSAEETQAILDNIADLTKPSLSLYLGSGLEVPDFHPFSFRPIIHILDQENKIANTPGGGGGSNYYDTSRPCPPACPPDN